MSFVEFSHEHWLILSNFHYWIWSELEVFLYAHYWIKWAGFYFNSRVVIAKAERKTTRKISNLFYRPCKFLDSRLMNRTLFSASSLPVSLANVVSFVMLCYVKRYDPVSFLIKKKTIYGQILMRIYGPLFLHSVEFMLIIILFPFSVTSSFQFLKLIMNLVSSAVDEPWAVVIVMVDMILVIWKLMLMFVFLVSFTSWKCVFPPKTTEARPGGRRNGIGCRDTLG